MRSRRPLTASALRALAMGAVICASAPASAQEAAAAGGNLTLQLNKQEDIESGCRLTYVAVNGTKTALEEVSYDIAVFDGKGQISVIMTFDFGKMPIQKTKIIRFDIADMKCAEISRLVISEATRCVSAGATLPLCIEAVQPTSLTNIALGL